MTSEEVISAIKALEGIYTAIGKDIHNASIFECNDNAIFKSINKVRHHPLIKILCSVTDYRKNEITVFLHGPARLKIITNNLTVDNIDAKIVELQLRGII